MDTRAPFALIADLLDYPGPSLRESASRATETLAQLDPGAGVELRSFQSFLGTAALGCVEERYTNLFDLPASCPPYAGYHLLGEDWRRNVLLARLNRRYRERGFSPGTELPDHVVVLLRYLAMGEHGAEEGELLREVLLPCVERMGERLGVEDRDYGALLRGIGIWLRALVGESQTVTSAV